MATTAWAERSNSSATHCPGPTPWPTSRCANRLAASSSSRYVSERPSKVTAAASGERCTCLANSTGTDTAGGAGWVNTARLPISSSPASSPASSTSIDDNRRVGSAVIAATTRCSRWISVWMLSGSNTSVRNSTVPPIPAGSPAWVQRSANENARSTRAVWVSTGIWVTCRSPNASPAAGSLLSCPGRFCQANITCTSG